MLRFAPLMAVPLIFDCHASFYCSASTCALNSWSCSILSELGSNLPSGALLAHTSNLKEGALPHTQGVITQAQCIYTLCYLCMGQSSTRIQSIPREEKGKEKEKRTEKEHADRKGKR